ncbi:hypothetical protein GC163_19110 [bacterium]|nr:hypothetical protein [bacterium]
MTGDFSGWNPDEVTFDGITETPVVLPEVNCQTECRQCRARIAADALICPQCGRPVNHRVSTTLPTGARDKVLAISMGIFSLLLSLPVNIIGSAVLWMDGRRNMSAAVFLCVWNGWFFGVPAIHLLVEWRKNVVQKRAVISSYWREFWWIQFVQMLIPGVLIAFSLLLVLMSQLQQWVLSLR